MNVVGMSDEEFQGYEFIMWDIFICVELDYMEDEFEFEVGCFVWFYMIEIENYGKCLVQLMLCKWVIIDVMGCQEYVQGFGVVGEQFVIELGQCFCYISGVLFFMFFGFIQGSYEMVIVDGESFVVIIFSFLLDCFNDVVWIYQVVVFVIGFFCFVFYVIGVMVVVLGLIMFIFGIFDLVDNNIVIVDVFFLFGILIIFMGGVVMLVMWLEV